jgi:CBS domain-containing protein
MQGDVRTVAPDTTIVDLERLLLQERVGGLPVLDRDGQLLGIVSRSDVVRQLSIEQSLGEAMSDAYRDQTNENWTDSSREEIGTTIGQRMQRLRVCDMMIRDVVTVAPDDSLQDAARCLVERHFHRLPVVEGDRLVGIVSSLDLARLIADGGLRATD